MRLESQRKSGNKRNQYIIEFLYVYCDELFDGCLCADKKCLEKRLLLEDELLDCIRYIDDDLTNLQEMSIVENDYNCNSPPKYDLEKPKYDLEKDVRNVLERCRKENKNENNKKSTIDYIQGH